MTPEQIMEDFSRGYPRSLPRKALLSASEQRGEMVPIFLAQIEDAIHHGDHSSEDTINSFLFIFHLLAEWGEIRAYRPLIEFLKQPNDTLDLFIGDAITTTAWRVIYSVFDGDFDPIISLIEDSSADEFARSAMFQTLTAMALKTPDLRPQVLSIMQDFFEKAGSGKKVRDNYVWSGWCTAICELGATEFLERAKTIYEPGGVDEIFGKWETFEKEVRDVAAGEEGRQWWREKYDSPVIDSTVEELAGWHCFSKKALKEAVDARLLEPFQKREALFAETGKVGRNDPCPCGSGKKFKKCCLN